MNIVGARFTAAKTNGKSFLFLADYLNIFKFYLKLYSTLIANALSNWCLDNKNQR